MSKSEDLKKENISLFFNEVINEELIENDESKELELQKMMDELENDISIDLMDNGNFFKGKFFAKR